MGRQTSTHEWVLGCPPHSQRRKQSCESSFFRVSRGSQGPCRESPNQVLQWPSPLSSPINPTHSSHLPQAATNLTYQTYLTRPSSCCVSPVTKHTYIRSTRGFLLLHHVRRIKQSKDPLIKHLDNNTRAERHIVGLVTFASRQSERHSCALFRFEPAHGRRALGISQTRSY